MLMALNLNFTFPTIINTTNTISSKSISCCSSTATPRN